MNQTLEENDVYLLWRHYTLSPTDRKVLTQCYLPLIGFESFSIYLFFDSYLQESNYNRGLVSNLKKMLNIKGFNFITAREKLEAVNLLKTYKKSLGDKDEYVFYLQQPLDPEQFFKNILLSSSLKNIIGNEAFTKLKFSFNISKKIDSGFENISAPFETYFKTDNKYFETEDEDNSELMSRINEETEYFNLEEFKRIYQEKEPFTDPSKIDEDIILILKKATELYHLNMDVVTNYYIDSLNNRGVFVEKAFIKKVRNLTEQTLDKKEKVQDEYVKLLGDNEVSNKIKSFTKLSPVEVMYYLTKTKPTVSDYELFEQLEKEFDLSPSVINVIIDFALAKSNGMFIKNYVLKTARTILYNEANKDAYLAYVTLNNIFVKAKSNANKEKILSNEVKSIAKDKKGKEEEKDSSNKLDDIVISDDDFAF